jgi:peptidyl-tRNA hydrolase
MTYEPDLLDNLRGESFTSIVDYFEFKRNKILEIFDDLEGSNNLFKASQL